MSAEVRKARQSLLGGAVIVAVGLAIAGTQSQVAGGVVTLAGWLLLVWGIHRFGRSR